MKKQILTDLHGQFANNQNEHENKFVAFFIAILALFAAYATTYSISSNWITNTYSVNKHAVAYLSILVCISLTFFIANTLTAAKVYRRDQFINDKIRKYSFTNEEYNFFFTKYKGIDKSWISFIPDFLQIRLGFLICLHLFTFTSVILLVFENKAPTYFYMTIFMISYALICFLWYKKFNDYKNFTKEDQECSSLNMVISQEVNTDKVTAQYQEELPSNKDTISQKISLNDQSETTIVSQSITLNKSKL